MLMNVTKFLNIVICEYSKLTNQTHCDCFLPDINDKFICGKVSIAMNF